MTNDPTPSIEPGAAEIRTALERVLASRCFAQAARSSSFLKFVVEQTLAGHGERLKGYTIALEVFDRSPDFDAQSDPLVRVEAGRLRRRLLEYYADEGRGDPVRIELPRGNYSVVASYQGRSADIALSALGPLPNEVLAQNADTRRLRWSWACCSLAAAVLVAGTAGLALEHFSFPGWRGNTPRVAQALAEDGAPSIVVMPFESLGGADGLAELAAALTEEMFLVLDRPTALAHPAEASGGAGSASTAYVLNGTVREADGRVRITARLAWADTGKQIWSEAYNEPLDGLRSPAGQHRAARRIGGVAEPYGPLFDTELMRTRGVAADALRTRDCVLRYYDYRRALGAARHASALYCFERALERESTADGWAGLSLLLVDAWAHGFAGDGGDDAVLERAREAARRAMDIDGRNLRANLALLSVQFFSGADMPHRAERILAAWPESAEAAALVGTMLVLSGRTQRGSALVENAIEWTPRPPGAYFAARSLVALREQRYADALASALRVDSPDWPLGHVILAAAGSLGGRRDLAARARAQLLELDPFIETSLPELLNRCRIEPALAHELERGFAAAGWHRHGVH